MKTISLWQPWATLIASGAKRIETRSWYPSGLKIGQKVAIHAAKRWTAEERALCAENPFFTRYLQLAERRGLWSFEHPPLGCVVAIATFTGARRTGELSDIITDREDAFGNFGPGRWGWQFGPVFAIEPVPLRGQQGIFEWVPDAPLRYVPLHPTPEQRAAAREAFVTPRAPEALATPQIPAGAVVFACARPTSRGDRRGGASGSLVSADGCPKGYDPRHCDAELRTPYPGDARFYTCGTCGKQGKFVARTSEAAGATTDTRVVNVKLEPCDVYIGRTMPGGKWVNAGWGNPFSRKTTDTPVADFRAWIQTQPQLLARLPELRGKRLGCWCAPKGGLPGNINGHTCHGEILAALADGAVLPQPEASLGRPIAAGDRVRIIEHAQSAYERAYWGHAGIAVSVSTSRYGVRRWLVDYLPTGGFGRYQVREEHLERVAAAAEATVESETHA